MDRSLKSAAAALNRDGSISSAAAALVRDLSLKSAAAALKRGGIARNYFDRTVASPAEPSHLRSTKVYVSLKPYTKRRSRVRLHILTQKAAQQFSININTR